MHLAMCLGVTTDFFPACFSVFLSNADHAVVLNSFRQTRFMLQWLQADFTVHLPCIAEVESCKCRAINGSSPVARQAHNLKVGGGSIAMTSSLRGRPRQRLRSLVLLRLVAKYDLP